MSVILPVAEQRYLFYLFCGPMHLKSPDMYNEPATIIPSWSDIDIDLLMVAYGHYRPYHHRKIIIPSHSLQTFFPFPSPSVMNSPQRHLVMNFRMCGGPVSFVTSKWATKFRFRAEID